MFIYLMCFIKGLNMKLKLVVNEDMQNSHYVDSNNNKWD